MADDQKTRPEGSGGISHPAVRQGEDTQVDAVQQDTLRPASAPGSAELKPGQVLGKCRIVKELGRGGMGAVYMAKHTTLDVEVAVKILPPEIASRHPQFAERFMREARLAAKLKHASIIQVMDAEHDEKTGLYYIVMEFVDGGSVRDLMDKGPMLEAKAIDIVIRVTEALVGAADLNIVHRDIKPDNIMLTKNGQVKLADMGIAKERSDGPSMTLSAAMMGTPAYVSPEQATDAKNVDARADIYSLGATLYYMLIGSPPYEGETAYSVLTKLATEPTPDPRDRRPDVSEATAFLCMRMMAKNPEERPQSAKDLLEELTKVRSLLATSATTAVAQGQIVIKPPPGPARGTPTQGISGTAFGMPQATAAGAAAPAGAFAQQTAVGAGATTLPPASAPAVQMSSTALFGLLAAGVVILIAVLGFVFVGNRQQPPAQPSPAPVMAGSTTPDQTSPAPSARSGLVADRPGHGEGASPDIAKTPGSALPASIPALEMPKDDELVKQAISAAAKLPPQEVKMGTAIFKNQRRPDWPRNSEIRLAGFGDTDEKAEEAACQTALSTVLKGLVGENPTGAAQGVLSKIMSAPREFVYKPTVIDKGEEGDAHYAAISVTPKAGKIGKALYDAGVEVTDIYALVGKPSVGVDIKERVLDMKGAEVKFEARRVQRAIEQELEGLNIAIVDVSGMDKKVQIESCDVLITGASDAALRWDKPLPGGSMPLYAYNCELSLDIILASTGRKAPIGLFNFAPKGLEEIQKYGDFQQPEAAKKTIQAVIDNNIGTIAAKLKDAWVKHSGAVDYWVGVKNVKGVKEIQAVLAALQGLDGIGEVTRRYYRDGTAEFAVQYDGTSVDLASLIEGKSKLPMVLAGQEGLRLEFDLEK